jgi:GNAT superfamily N-acetyltransferase
MIVYAIESGLSAEEFIDVLVKSTLGERRPVNDLERIKKMLAHADLILTARVDGKLVGVSRAITDFVYCTYLSDLAVDAAFQHKGIGKELVKRTKLEFPEAKLILLAAPAAVDYYPKIGMTKFENAFVLNDADALI